MSAYREPGRIDPPPGWSPCARCKGWLSLYHNARSVPGTGIVCIPCFEEPSK